MELKSARQQTCQCEIKVEKKEKKNNVEERTQKIKIHTEEIKKGEL